MGDLLDPSGATSALAGWKPRRRFRECPVSLVQPLPERPTDQHFLPHRDHSRLFDQNLYVYPVLSRRSRGISVGINLNPDKVCNFDCVYCQVDRRTTSQVTDVDEEQLLQELEETLELVLSGRLYLDQRFASVPDPLRRLNDIAFSGDGEPTTYPRLRPDRPGCRCFQEKAEAGRGQARPHHQRDDAPPAPCERGAGDPRCQQR